MRNLSDATTHIGEYHGSQCTCHLCENVPWDDVEHEESHTMISTLYADNDLQQEIIDDIASAYDLSPDEQMSCLRDIAYAQDLYNFFGMLVSNEHVVRTYNTHKESIRQELANLNDAGADVADWLRTNLRDYGRWDHTDFAAKCLLYAVWNAANTLLDRAEYEG